MTNIIKNSNQMKAQPFIHIPKFDKTTGEPIPEWKQQVMMTKIAKRIEQEQSVQNQVSFEVEPIYFPVTNDSVIKPPF